jgi:multicomponent Na+:H+ antiporter subunit C
MTSVTLFGLCGALLVGLGLYGLVIHPHPLRKLISFNLLGSGILLIFGVIARRGAESGVGGDPVPQALVITGIVVAFAATALAAGLLLRLFGANDSAMAGAAETRREPAERSEP